MEEKKKNSSKKKSTASSNKNESKKTPAKKVSTTKNTVKKETNKKQEKVSKKETVVAAEEKVLIEKKETKREKKSLIKWFNNLTLEQIIIGGVIILTILLIVLICVSTKNTKTKNGDDIVVKVDGKTITANDLYAELKKQNGRNTAINMIDEYILNKEYKTTDEMKKSAQATIDNYKNTYGDNYNSFLEYNGISNDSELKELLIKNSKLTKAVDKYIKDNLTESEMKKYYEDKIVGDIKASHILVSFNYEDKDTDEEKENKKNAALEKAKNLIERIKNGEDFATLAKENSDDEGSKENGGDLGFFNTGQMVESFEKAAYDLEVNEYTTEPVESTYGYHIIIKTDKKEKPSYKKSKDTIIEKLVEEKKDTDSTVSTKALIDLRKKYKMNIKDKTINKDYNSYIKEAVTTTTTTQSSK